MSIDAYVLYIETGMDLPGGLAAIARMDGLPPVPYIHSATLQARKKDVIDSTGPEYHAWANFSLVSEPDKNTDRALIMFPFSGANGGGPSMVTLIVWPKSTSLSPSERANFGVVLYCEDYAKGTFELKD